MSARFISLQYTASPLFAGWTLPRCDWWSSRDDDGVHHRLTRQIYHSFSTKCCVGRVMENSQTCALFSIGRCYFLYAVSCYGRHISLISYVWVMVRWEIDECILAGHVSQRCIWFWSLQIGVNVINDRWIVFRRIVKGYREGEKNVRKFIVDEIFRWNASVRKSKDQTKKQQL